MKTVSVPVFIALTAIMLLFACEFKQKGRRNPIEIKLAPPEVPKSKTRYFTGTFGKSNVYLYLEQMQGVVKGGYYFAADSVEHTLSGNLTKEGATIFETDNKGGKIAILKGSINAQGQVTGTMAKMDGTENVQVMLQVTKDSTLYQPKPR